MSAEVYEAHVVSGADPLGQGRVKVLVPQVSGSAVSTWAAPTVRTYGPVPASGSTVWVGFDTGDAGKPVYFSAGLWSPWTQAPASWMGANWSAGTGCYRLGPFGAVQWRGAFTTDTSPVNDGDTVATLPAFLIPASPYPDDPLKWGVIYSPNDQLELVQGIVLDQSGALTLTAGGTTAFTESLALNLAPIAYSTL